MLHTNVIGFTHKQGEYQQKQLDLFQFNLCHFTILRQKYTITSRFEMYISEYIISDWISIINIIEYDFFEIYDFSSFFRTGCLYIQIHSLFFLVPFAMYLFSSFFSTSSFPFPYVDREDYQYEHNPQEHNTYQAYKLLE